MKAYIAGPMTGYPSYNVVAFEWAAALWKSRGYEVVTPFDCCNMVFRKHFGTDFDPHNDTIEDGSASPFSHVLIAHLPRRYHGMRNS